MQRPIRAVGPKGYHNAHIACLALPSVPFAPPLPYSGMVESAFEFAEVCRKHDYHNFVFSMKASNPLVMVQAYRLLAEEMYKKGWDYPLHLGVTGEQGCLIPRQGSQALSEREANLVPYPDVCSTICALCRSGLQNQRKV